MRHRLLGIIVSSLGISFPREFTVLLNKITFILNLHTTTNFDDLYITHLRFALSILWFKIIFYSYQYSRISIWI
jgi:hypothetical protein